MENNLVIKNEVQDVIERRNTKPKDLMFFAKNSELDFNITGFYFKIFDFIKGKLEKNEFEKIKNNFDNSMMAEEAAFKKIKALLKNEDYLKLVLRTLKNKNIIYLKDNHIYFKNEQEEFILSLNDIENYQRLHLSIALKTKDEKKEIREYIFSKFQTILESQNAYNIESSKEVLLGLMKNVAYCSLFAFEKAFEYFALQDKMKVADFIHKVRSSHEQKKSDAVRFVNLILEVLP